MDGSTLGRCIVLRTEDDSARWPIAATRDLCTLFALCLSTFEAERRFDGDLSEEHADGYPRQADFYKQVECLSLLAVTRCRNAASILRTVMTLYHQNLWRFSENSVLAEAYETADEKYAGFTRQIDMNQLDWKRLDGLKIEALVIEVADDDDKSHRYGFNIKNYVLDEENKDAFEEYRRHLECEE